MKERLLKANRILRVQEQLQRISELKLARLDQKIAELRHEESALIETLNGSDKLQGLFVEARSKRLQSLAVQVSQLENAKVLQKKVVLDRAMQAKRAEKMAVNLKSESRRHEEKKSLLEILDRLSVNPDTSLP